MAGFIVNLQELHDAVRVARPIIDDFTDSPALKYSIAPNQVGHAALESALAEFHHVSATRASDLIANAHTFLDNLTATADAYSDADTLAKQPL